MSYSLVEFYNNGSVMVHAESSIVPPVGAYVSFNGKEYKVTHVWYSIDKTENFKATLRAKVNVERTHDGY